MPSVTLHDYKKRLQRVLHHVRTHLDKELPVDALAAVACLSPFHFHRIFSGMIGETVAALVRRLRLERAALQLRNTTAAILEIALDAGYESHEAFGRAFTRAYGLSPGKFHRNHARPCAWPARCRVHYADAQASIHFRTIPFRPLPMKITLNTLPPQNAACLRHIGPYDQCGPTWARLGDLLGATGEIEIGSTFIGISYDDPEFTPSSEIRSDAGVSVPSDFIPHDGLTVREIAGGEDAVLTYEGPYSRLRRAYRHLMGEWAASKRTRTRRHAVLRNVSERSGLHRPRRSAD
ncbi:MAG: AraC family transcriptional regulator [Candidatus Synoicihabitans palmerolidicus]|nr:AraC family transcriptional regulator [Candidatus Synoicihabitans palmerolidicus]